MSLPGAQRLFDVCDATWPAARVLSHGPWTLRDGRGGGQRVSAATTTRAVTASQIAEAEAAMRAMGQNPLFQIRPGNGDLDAALDGLGYEIRDPTGLMLTRTEDIAAMDLPRVAAFTIWPPLAIMNELWDDGGIDAGRRAVMARGADPKTGLLGRHDDRPAGVGYGGIADGIAMFHAIEVAPAHRRGGVARHMMIAGARWARDHDAAHIAVLCTRANSGATACYYSLGFEDVGQYHYRTKSD